MIKEGGKPPVPTTNPSLRPHFAKNFKPKDPWSIFIHNLPPSPTAKEVWTFFKKVASIKDVILPRQRDKNNKRYGFIISYRFSEAQELIRLCNGKKFLNFTLLAKFSSPAIPRPSKPSSPEKKPEQLHAPKSNVSNSFPALTKDPKFTILGLDMQSKDEPLFGDNKNTLEHRVITLSLDKEVVEEMEASLIAWARAHFSVQSILKYLEKEGTTSIKVKKLSPLKFLLTFPSKKDKSSWDLGWLDPWFSSFMDVTHKELVLPRKAYIVMASRLTCGT